MMTQIPLTQLRPHPSNSNVMPRARMDALKAHIARSGKYPPLIVRPLAPGQGDEERSVNEGGRAAEDAEKGDVYQLLDGHHRAAVLRELGYERAACVVWEVSDEDALLLLATLNRLEGADDGKKRSALLEQLQGTMTLPTETLKLLLPDAQEDLERMFANSVDKGFTLAPPPDVASMPTAMCFFVTASQRAEVEAALDTIGGDRTEALLRKLRGEGD